MYPCPAFRLTHPAQEALKNILIIFHYFLFKAKQDIAKK
jgi:hypothetical protein